MNALQHLSVTQENPWDQAKTSASQSARTFGRDITNQQLQDFDSPSPDPVRLSYYAKDIHAYLHAVQAKTQPRPGFMKLQTDITDNMRSILVNWLVEVHYRFKLVPETLFLVVNYLDRFLERETVQRSQLQLIGIVAMELACKFEELYAPEIRELIYLTDNTYSTTDFLAMELRMLEVLNYTLSVPTAYRFYERYARLAQLDQRSTFLGEFLLELSLLDTAIVKYKPSLVAAAGVYLARKMTDPTAVWGAGLTAATLHSDSEVRPCAKDLVIVLQSSEHAKLAVIKRKFSSEKFYSVAQLASQHSASSTPRSCV